MSVLIISGYLAALRIGADREFTPGCHSISVSTCDSMPFASSRATISNTLGTIAEREFNRVWPGHRDVIDTPTERAQFIIDHHRERAERVIEVLDEHGPADAWAVSAQLFGDLKGIHFMHGPGEAYAHLDHLARHNIVEETAEGYDLRAKTKATIDDVI